MTDLEITKACAAAIGIHLRVVDDSYLETPHPYHTQTGARPTYWTEYRPLSDDAQAMALLFWITTYAEVVIRPGQLLFTSDDYRISMQFRIINPDYLRRAIAESAATLWKAMHPEPL